MGIVIIKRKTGLWGSGSALTVKRDGEKAAELLNDQEIVLSIPKERARVRVSQFGAKSNELTVADGDIVEITTTKWSYLLYIVSVFMPVFASFISPATRRLIFLLNGFIAVLVSQFVMERFQMKVVDRLSD